VSSNIPDYELADSVEASTPTQMRALADPLRLTLLDLVLERAATVTELAEAVDRPKSTIAHHVNVLLDAGLMRVVRTRRVRAIEERFYGRTGRTIYTGVRHRPGDSPLPVCINQLAVAAGEAVPAHEADDLRTTLRHARIPRERASAFWARVEELVLEFAQIPREGDTVYGFAAGLYPTDYPTLPDPEQDA
jgi:DNA-binding transcriptional ArsR family regulator